MSNKCGADELEVSSLHMTFNTEDEWAALGQLGYQQRTGIQYHWENQGYSSFDDFLMNLKQSKRKNIRQERKSVAKQGLKLRRLSGDDLKSHHWDDFYGFYRNTTGGALPPTQQRTLPSSLPSVLPQADIGEC